MIPDKESPANKENTNNLKLSLTSFKKKKNKENKNNNIGKENRFASVLLSIEFNKLLPNVYNRINKFDNKIYFSDYLKITFLNR